VRERVTVLTLGNFEGALFELDVALVFQVSGCPYQSDVVHHPSSGSSVSDLNELDFEDESCATWNFRRRPHRSVGVLGLYGEFSSLAELHAHDSDIPTLNHLADTDGYFESLLVF